MRASKIEVDVAKNDRWFCRLKGGNGEPEMFSETYYGRTSNESRRGALRAARRLAQRIAGARVFVWDEARQKFVEDEG